MARDLYAALAAAHGGARPMSAITTSEQRHYDAVGSLLARYGLADPAAGRAAGSYADAELQRLYDDWYARGKVSPQAAYRVGIELEQRDIADLQRLIAEHPPTDVATVYRNLLAGSRNHLAAYQRAADGSTAGTGRAPEAGRGGPGSSPSHARGQGRQAPGQGAPSQAGEGTLQQGAQQRRGQGRPTS